MLVCQCSRWRNWPTCLCLAPASRATIRASNLSLGESPPSRVQSDRRFQLWLDSRSQRHLALHVEGEAAPAGKGSFLAWLGEGREGAGCCTDDLLLRRRSTDSAFRSGLATTLMCGGGGYVTQTVAPYAGGLYGGYGGFAGYGGIAGWTGGQVVQQPTVWSGDSVLGGGQPEWASEDAAQHALNLANWRIKLLQAKLQQAKLTMSVMNVGTPGLTSKKASSSTTSQLSDIRKGLASLAKQTTHAISALAHKVDANGRANPTILSSHEKLMKLKSDTDRELDDIRELFLLISLQKSCTAPAYSRTCYDSKAVCAVTNLF